MMPWSAKPQVPKPVVVINLNFSGLENWAKTSIN